MCSATLNRQFRAVISCEQCVSTNDMYIVGVNYFSYACARKLVQQILSAAGTLSVTVQWLPGLLCYRNKTCLQCRLTSSWQSISVSITYMIPFMRTCFNSISKFLLEGTVSEESSISVFNYFWKVMLRNCVNRYMPWQYVYIFLIHSWSTRRRKHII